MTFRKLLTGLLICAACAPAALAQDATCTVSGRVKLVDQNDILIPAPEAGILMELPFAEGAQVMVDQVIAKLDDRDAKLRMEAANKEYAKAKVQADSTADIEAAQKAQEVAEAEAEENRYLNKVAPDAVTTNELRRSILTAERARLQKVVAEHEHLVATYTAESTASQAAIAKNDYEKRAIKAPLGGRIEEIHGKRGQWLQQGEPLLRLVQMDRLKVEGFVSANQYSQQQLIGQPVTVRVTLAHDREEQFNGTVKFVGYIIDGKGDFRIWAEVENRAKSGEWLLHPGRAATMTIAVRSADQLEVQAEQQPQIPAPEAANPTQTLQKPVVPEAAAPAATPASTEPPAKPSDSGDQEQDRPQVSGKSAATSRAVRADNVAPRKRFRQ